MSELRAARPFDRPEIEALLRAADLPVPGPGEPEVEFVVAADDGGVVACGGWEIHSRQALLRSVAVTKERRARGLGRKLVEDVIRRLAERGIDDVTLVTLDADEFFRGLGFENIARNDVPEAVRASPEFRIHHCASGHWMRRRGH